MYPGDQRPQYTSAMFNDNAVKFTMGISKTFGSLGVCLDYNISKFNILTLGLDVGF
jgi:Flp pilus assembly protein TadB